MVAVAVTVVIISRSREWAGIVQRILSVMMVVVVALV